MGLRLLDLFCGAGGAGEGYRRAGFDVTGVDHRPMPRNPHTFVQADALEYLAAHGREYDVIHASPPCQGYSRMRHLPWLKNRKYPLLIPETLRLLEAAGRPWALENVADAWPALTRFYSITLCGAMFGLKVYRHRLFASSHLLWQPEHPRHITVIGSGRMLNDRAGCSRDGWVSLPSKPDRLRRYWGATDMVSVGGNNFQMGPARAALGIHWMNRKELSQALPPAYTHFIGKQLLRALEGE